MIAQAVEVFVATEPVDMRYGFEWLCGLVRERMGREPYSRALYKKLDAGLFELHARSF